jgi:hypothetical protein
MIMKRVLLTLVVGGLVSLWVGAASAQAELEFEALQTVPRGGSAYEWTNLPQTPVDATQLAENKIALTVGGTTISCGTATASSTLAEGSSPTLVLAPAYSGCKAGGLANAEVATKGCTFDVHSLVETGADAFIAQANIGCPPEGEILVTVSVFGISSCLIHVYPQTSLKTVKVTNLTEASPASVTIKSEIETMKAVVANGKASCSVTPGSYSNAKFTGTTTVTATGTTGEVPSVPPRVVVRNYKKFHFQFESKSLRLLSSAETPQEFTFDAGNVTCKKAEWDETYLLTEKSIYFTSAVPYEECEFGGVEKAEFVMGNLCLAVMKSGKQMGGAYLGLYTIVCPANVVSEIKFTGCTIRLFSQNGPGNTGYLRRVTFENVGLLQGREIKAKLEVFGLEYEEVGVLCEHPGIRKKNGSLQGKMRWKGELAAAQRGVWVQLTN